MNLLCLALVVFFVSTSVAVSGNMRASPFEFDGGEFENADSDESEESKEQA